MKNLPEPTDFQKAASKAVFDNNFNDPSLVKSTDHIDLKKNLHNVRFVKVSSCPAFGEHLTVNIMYMLLLPKA